LAAEGIGVRPIAQVLPYLSNEGKQLDKDRIKGAAKQAKGAAKGAAGKLAGDPKLRADGAADKVECSRRIEGFPSSKMSRRP
jgi:uncharacterized protein YjbJ (UPF0337 family)